MGTTAQKLQAVANSKAAIKAAIQAKGVSDVGDVLSAYATKISQIPSGGGGAVERKDVNFIDYDGKVLHSYTKQEALALTELPALPSRTEEGLTCQEWNYTLAQMKSNVNSSGKCDVGATYITTDGKTHIYITIPDEKYGEVTIRYQQSQASGVTIDWGDGTTPSSSAASGNRSQTHRYSPASYPHQYVIKVGAVNGTMAWNNGNIMCSSTSESASNPVSALCGRIDKVYIGNVTSIGNEAFLKCISLTSITIPNSVTSIGYHAFEGCSGLTSVTIPDSVTSIGNYAFQGCSGLTSVNIPDSVKSIGDYAFSLCSGLTSVTIPASVTSIGSSAFYNCSGLTSVTIPDSVKSIGDNAFDRCSGLTSVNIPDSVKSIGNYAFYGCSSLTNITIPNNVTSIGDNAFRSCYGLRTVDCTRCQQVPTLANTNAFQNTNNFLEIIVPNSLYYDWIAATNWSTYADRIKMQYPSLTFRATQANSTITLEQAGEPEVPAHLEYIQGHGGWQTYTVGDTITLANVGDAVLFRATPGYTNNFGSSEEDYHQFVMSGGIEAIGSINYLTNSEGYDQCGAYCFYNLFSGCGPLEAAPLLPGYVDGEYCFAHMFDGCYQLTEAPEIPSGGTYEYCFAYMFSGSGLTSVTVPDGGSLENGCYESMFEGCDGLSEIKLGYTGSFSNDYFYNWVAGVASTGTFYYDGTDTTRGSSAIPVGWTVEEIPVPYLCFKANAANSTVKMMKSGSAPTVSLEYTTDKNTWQTFTVGTTTVTLPNIGDKMWLRAVSTNAKMAGSYSTNYNYFAMTGQIEASGNINSLLNKEPDLVTTCPQYAYPHLFDGCSALVDAQNLKLASATASTNSYGHKMFYNCTNLVHGPEIMATNLLTLAYTAEYMFQGCSSLQSVKIHATGSTWNSSATVSWMDGVSSTGTFYYNGSYTGRGASYIPTGWTITPFSA